MTNKSLLILLFLIAFLSKTFCFALENEDANECCIENQDSITPKVAEIDNLLIKNADSDDTETVVRKVKKPKKAKNPTIATVLSACLPGAGQIYNGHWWKLPIIYGGIAALSYGMYVNNGEYTLYKNELYARTHGEAENLNPKFAGMGDANLRDSKDYYKRNIDLLYIGFAGVYLLNIIDACVFAHLSTFDISEDLTMQIKPYCRPMQIPTSSPQLSTGLTINFTFK
jgi:hypothetical protein